jgi:hypothetical protein
MSGHRPFSELTKHFTEEERRLNAIGSERLNVKVRLAETIGEQLLLQNDELSDLLCEAELDFSDRELVQAIEEQVAAVAGTAQDLTPGQRQRIAELTGEVRAWIALAESTGV